MRFEDAVNSALVHRNNYLGDESFEIALDYVSSSHQIAAKDELHKSVVSFLKGKDITYPINLESLLQSEHNRPAAEDVQLFGETLHFARKNVLTGYEVVPSSQDKTLNPLVIMNYTFEALAPSDNRHAAKFLENMCGLMNKEGYVQAMLTDAVSLILPSLGGIYQKDLASIRFDESDARYTAEKVNVDQRHMEHLNKFILYSREVLAGHKNNSVKDFYKFAGIEDSNGSERKTPTVLYMSEVVAAANGKPKGSPIDYKELIRKIEAECGAIIDVDWSGHKDHDDATIHLFMGNANAPARHLLTYKKGDVPENMKQLYIAICNHALGNGAGRTTSNARKNIGDYL